MSRKPRFGYVVEPSPKEPGVPEVTAKPGMLAVPEMIAHPADYALPPQRKGRHSEPGLKRTDVPREQLNVRIRPELKHAAAVQAAKERKTLGDVVEAALIEFLERADRGEGER